MTSVAVDVLLAERHRDRFGSIQDNAVDMSLRAWDSLEDWTSPGAADAWAELWLPIDGAATSASAVSTDAYFSLATEVEGMEFGGLDGAGLRGVPAEEYARRPLAELYRQLGEGALWGDAFAAARDRLSAMVATDVSLGQRKAASDWTASGKIVGYRRTLSGASCVLCALASTQRYTRGDLMPIHGRCDCGVSPIRGDEDPGRVINKQLLADLKSSGAAGDLSLQLGASRAEKWAKNNRARAEELRAQGADLGPIARHEIEKKAARFDIRAARQEDRAAAFREQRRKGVRYEVHQHGELGPVITRKGDHFQGPSITN